MTFRNRSSLVVYPVNHLTPEVIDLIFGSNNEILFQYLEKNENGIDVAWLKLRTPRLVDQYVSAYSEKEILGQIVHVISVENYMKSQNSNKYDKSSSDEEADSSDFSDTFIGKQNIYDYKIIEKTPFKIPHYSSSDSSDDTVESHKNHKSDRGKLSESKETYRKRRHHSHRHRHSKHHRY